MVVNNGMITEWNRKCDMCYNEREYKLEKVVRLGHFVCVVCAHGVTVYR